MAELVPEEQFQAFRGHAHVGPIQMLNLLRVRDGGRESYQRYVEECKPLVEKRGGRILYRAQGRITLIGPDSWDEVILVMYPSRAAFIDMVESDEYKAVRNYRQDAIQDSRLYMTTELSIP